jgi:hypothetical protein
MVEEDNRNLSECYVIRCCMKEVALLRGTRENQVPELIIAAMLDLKVAVDAEWKEDVGKFVSRVSMNADRVRKIFPAALRVVADHYDRLLPRLKNIDEPLATFVTAILNKHLPFDLKAKIAALAPDLKSGMPRADIQDDIFQGWRKGGISTSDLRDGIYQIFRRHKPVGSIETEPREHAMVTEMVRVDTVTKSCVLVDASGHVFNGTIHVNPRSIGGKKVAYFLYERSIGVDNGFEFRFYTLVLEGRSDIYPSLCIRLGDVTGRPVMSECLSIFVGRHDNQELYEAFAKLASDPLATGKLSNDSILLDYIAPAPKRNREKNVPEWQELRHIKDFPFFSALIKVPSGTLARFQEPIRSPNNSEMFEITADTKLDYPDVFRHSKCKKAEKK